MQSDGDLQGLVELVGVAEVEGDEVKHEVEGGSALPQGIVAVHPVALHHPHRHPLDSGIAGEVMICERSLLDPPPGDWMD